MKRLMVGMGLVAMVLLLSPAARAEHIEYQIAASADDTHCSPGSNYVGNSTTFVPYNNDTERRPFFRWAVNIPYGATIESAYLKIKAQATGTEASTIGLWLLDYDNCPSFSTNPYSSAPVAGTDVNWVMPDPFAVDTWFTSPDIKTIVQAFVDRPNYSPGNYLGLQGRWVSGTYRVAYQRDSGAANGAILEVNYSGGISNQPPVADAGSDQEVTDHDGNGLETVTLDGRASRDSDGTVVSYVWQEGSTPIASGPTAQVSLSLGTHRVTLTVTDNGGLMRSDEVVIVVKVSTAATYYVDFDGGSDANDGTTPAAAWKHCPGDPAATGRPASFGLVPGDVVIFKGGVVYRGQIICTWSGDESAAIVFDGNTAGTFGVGSAIIDGSEPITGWTPCQSAEQAGGNLNWQNIWYAYAPAGTAAWSSNLYENDSVCAMAQDPNQPSLWLMDDINYFHPIPPSDMTTTSVTDAAHLARDDSHYWDGASIMLWVVPNVINYRTVSGFDQTAGRISYAATGNPYADRNGYYSIFNSIHLIDTAGEYYFSDAAEVDGTHKVWLWPPVAGNPNQQLVTVSVRDQAIQLLSSPKYIVIQGFIIQKFASTSARCQGITIYDLNSTGHDVTIRNNTIRRLRHLSTQGYGTGYGAIWNQGVYANLLIDGNIFEDIMNSEGMLVGGAYVTITNNIIRRIGRHGIWMMGGAGMHDGLVADNHITDCLGTHGVGISIFGASISDQASRMTVRRNYVQAGTEAFSFSFLTDSTYAYNVGISPGCYVMHDNVPGSVNVAIHNNTLIRDGDYPSLASQAGSTYDIRNNLMLSYYYSGASLTPDANRNIRFRHDMINALFVDPAGGDYRLKDGSPAIDAGFDLGYATDFEGVAVPQGVAPDIGAYEFYRGPTVSAAMGRPWVYQNTPVTTGGRHVVYLTVSVADSTSFAVTVAKNAASAGDVTILPTPDPQVWAIAGSLRQANGLAGTGAVTLDIIVTDIPSGAQGTTQANLSCRQLGDIDGLGGVSGQDKLLLNKRLNGLVPDGREYDLDGAGGSSGQDKLILNKILNGIAIP